MSNIFKTKFQRAGTRRPYKKFMLCATKKCIGNDLDKIQHIDNEHQQRVVGLWAPGSGGGRGGGGYQNTLSFEVGKHKIEGAF